METGAWSGFTACWIAKALDDNKGDGKLFCIDNWQLYKGSSSEVHNALQMVQLANRVIVSDGDSHDPATWPPYVDMAWLDGDHSLEGVRQDLAFAIDRGATCLVLHDTVSWWGPRLVLDWLQSKGFQIIEAHFDEGLAIAMKVTPKPPMTYDEQSYPKGIVE